MAGCIYSGVLGGASHGAVTPFHVAVVRPEQAVSDAAVADEENGRQEKQAADGARLALEEEPDKVQHHEHDVRVHQRRVHGLGNQQDGN